MYGIPNFFHQNPYGIPKFLGFLLCKTKWAVWKLTGENLLDIRQYTRTSFMDTDRFVHTTNLVGRTIMLTCKLLLAGKK